MEIVARRRNDDEDGEILRKGYDRPLPQERRPTPAREQPERPASEPRERGGRERTDE